MKKKHLFISILLILLGTLVMTGCGGNSALSNASSWPGLTASEEDGVVYVSHGAVVEAVQDGKRLWFYPNNPDDRTRETFYAAPTVQGSELIVGSYLNRVHVLNKEDGSLITVVPLTDSKHKILDKILVTGNIDTSLVSSSDSTLYGVLLSDPDKRGEVVFSTKLSSEIWSSALRIPFRDLIYVATLDDKIHLLSGQLEGKSLKTIETNGAVMDGFVSWDGGDGGDGAAVYFSTLGGTVEAIDADRLEIDPNGNLVDSSLAIQTLITSENEFWAAPLVTAEMVMAVDMKGNVFAVTPKGEELWTRKNAFGESARVIARPVLLPTGEVLIVSGNGDMKIFDAEGKISYERSVGATVHSTPVIAGESIVLATTDGTELLKAYTFDLKEAWTFVGTIDAKTEATIATKAAEGK